MTRKRILVVEDTELNRELLVQLLEDDYEVVTAVNGEEGVALAALHRPDLILMDLSLPIVDGWHATRLIKATDGLKDIPIIAVSAHAMSGDEAAARACGCDDYLSKPIREEFLFEKVSRLLGSAARGGRS
jgi:two-component system cell cycle response regulator DivK